MSTPFATPFADIHPTTAGMRLANCGGLTLPGWELGWAQVIGTHHPDVTEDSLAHSAACGRWGTEVQKLALAVTDGVGGGARGDVASAALVQHVVAMPAPMFGQPHDIAQWMALAEAHVQLKLREVTFSPGAATLAAAWLSQPEVGASGMCGHILRVGDARLYRYDGLRRTIEPLTTDQTYTHVGEIPPGKASPEDPARMVGTNCMGPPEVQALELPWHHTLVLCTDGLHRGLPPQDMESALRRYEALETCALRMAQAARAAGSHDDITVFLARAAPPKPASHLNKWHHKIKNWFL